MDGKMTLVRSKSPSITDVLIIFLDLLNLYCYWVSNLDYSLFVAELNHEGLVLYQTHVKVDQT